MVSLGVVGAGVFAQLPLSTGASPEPSPFPRRVGISDPPAALGSASPVGSVSHAVVVPAVADATVESATPDANFGTTGRLRVDSTPPALTYLRFVVSGITAPPLSAQIRLFVISDHPGGFLVATASANWAEQRLTFSTRPRPTSSTLSVSERTIANRWVSADVTSVIRQNGTYDFQLSTTDASGLAFASREAGIASAPVLVLELPGPAPR